MLKNYLKTNSNAPQEHFLFILLYPQLITTLSFHNFAVVCFIKSDINEKWKPCKPHEKWNQNQSLWKIPCEFDFDKKDFW